MPIWRRFARQDAGGFYHATNYNFSVDWVRLADSIRLQPERGSLIGRVLLAGAAVQIPDVLADPEYTYADMQKAAGYRTLLGVPLLRGKEPIGVLFLAARRSNSSPINRSNSFRHSPTRP